MYSTNVFLGVGVEEIFSSHALEKIPCIVKFSPHGGKVGVLFVFPTCRWINFLLPHYAVKLG